MKVTIGGHIHGVDCSGRKVKGTVVRILVNTVVIENDSGRFLILKKQLRKHGYTLKAVKQTEVYNNEFSLAKEK